MRQYIRFTGYVEVEEDPFNWKTAADFVEAEILYPDWPVTFRVTEIGIVEDDE